MRIELKYRGEKRNLDLADDSSVADALAKSQINPETVLVKRNGEIIPETEKLKDNDFLELLSVISGG